MWRKTTLLISLFFFSIVMLIPKGYCSDQSQGLFDFSVIPTKLAEKLNIPVFACQILCSVILIFIPLAPVTIIARSKTHHAWIFELIVGMGMASFCVAIDWFPVWILIIVAIIVALMVANKFSGILTK